MRLFDKVAIVGVGLIGGSIALELKKKGLAKEVIGISRHKKSILLAKRKGAIDRGSQSLGIIKGADLVIFATPVNSIIALAWPISRIISKDCLVTDVGSTKKEIVLCLEKVFANFVGSHPLAGSEKRSIANSELSMFRGTKCILTPTNKTSSRALNRIKKLWINLGATVITISPEIHDKILSFTSHLPHVAAFSLMGVVPKDYLKFASTGLGDTTRIAASDPELWVDIFLSNRQNLLKNIDLFSDRLMKIKKAIQKKDRGLLNSLLEEAKEKRDSLSQL